VWFVEQDEQKGDSAMVDREGEGEESEGREQGGRVAGGREQQQKRNLFSTLVMTKHEPGDLLIVWRKRRPTGESVSRQTQESGSLGTPLADGHTLSRFMMNG
jgi:hypothetical protein